MENLADKETFEKHYNDLLEMGKTEDMDKIIDEQVGIVYDEFKGLIEGLTCCEEISHSILDREARFEYALANLKSYVWAKCRENMKK